MQGDFLHCMFSLSISTIQLILERAINAEYATHLLMPSFILLIDNQPSSVPSLFSSHLSRWKAGLFIGITQKHMLQRFSLLYVRKLYKGYEELDTQFQEIVANFCSDKEDLSEGCQGSVFNKIPHSHCSTQLCQPGTAQLGMISHTALTNRSL